MKKIILLSALAIFNVNVSATENHGFFSKYVVKEGLTHTESNLVLNGGPILNIITILNYFDKSTDVTQIIPAITFGYEKKYSDDSSILFNITAGSTLEFEKEN